MISRILEAVMPVLSRMMLLGALGAASGFAGFILERHWSFLAALFSFAEEALAFVLTNVNKFL
jgi:phage-related protein